MDNPLIFLLNLAWESRYKLPLLIAIGFMVLDIRMQLEITVESRRVRRARTIPLVPADNSNRPQEDDSSNDSWTTIEEELVQSSR